MPRKTQDISVIAELDRMSVPYQWAGDDEIKIRCPFHVDEHPSCDVSVSKRVFKCHGANCVGSAGGDFVTLMAGILKRPRFLVLEELATRYDLADHKIVEPEAVERWHQDIWLAGPLLAELRKRAVTDEDIVKHKLGEDNGRITIPVTNQRGDVVNVRRYLPGAPGNEKMRNMRGRGSARLFPEDQMSYPAVMLCGGEIKAIVAARQLNPHGVGAVCATMAEDLLPPEMLKRFAGKAVYVCEDIDAHGRAASEKNCIGLKPLAAEVYDVLLPLDAEKFPKGDINDFVFNGGDLWALIENLEPWAGPLRTTLHDEEPIKLHLAAATSAKYAAQRVTVNAIVATMDTAPYVVPKTVIVRCDKSQPFCSVCPAWSSLDGKFEIHPEHGAILAMVSTSKRHLPEALMEAVGVPRACRVCEFDAQTYYNAEDARLTPQLELTERASDARLQPAICIGEGLDLNEPYEFTGRMYPHPMTQQSTLLISRYDPTRDALSTYTPQDTESLKTFRPREWTIAGLDEKLDDLYGDLERNVTRIRQRRDMHVVVDLVYHSALLIKMDNRIVRGWTEALIIGDSAQGKTETVVNMMRHYGLGERMECKNASPAGLLGGCQQVGNGRWFVTWGFWPANDKRLGILEELKGATVETLAKLTDMRSSGIAEITKIEKRRTHARMRLIATSNPRKDRAMSSFSFPGVEATQDLIGSMEDIRRFDVVHALAKNEVDAEKINQLNASLNGDHPRYSPETCRSLVLWAWTRTPEQTKLSKEVALECMGQATLLCEEFTDAVPIVDRGSMRHKLARLATALACRTFSASEDGYEIVVRPCHVQWVADFLRRTYSTKAMGYREFTDAIRATDKLTDVDNIKKAMSSAPFPYQLVEHLLRTEKLEVQDVMDWCSWDRPEALTFVALLVRKHALYREYRHYRKTGAFIGLLRSVLDSRSMPERPDFIKENEF